MLRLDGDVVERVGPQLGAQVVLDGAELAFGVGAGPGTERAARLAVGEDAPPRETIRAALGVFLPRDDASRESTLLFVAFYVASLTNPTLFRPEARAVPDALHGFLADRVRQAQAAGDVAEGIDPDHEATILALMVAGLGQSILGGIHTPDAAADLVDYTLARLFRSR